MLRWATQIHKWLGLVIGLQVLAWVTGGLVMTAIPIEKVRGEHHVAAYRPQALPGSGVLDEDAAAQAAGVDAVEATLKTTLRGTLWILTDAEGRRAVVDARTGAAVTPLPAGEARLLASVQYEGTGQPGAPKWLTKPPQEAGKQAGPLWRVDFDDKEKTALYVSPETGEVVVRRSALWRFYDFWWRVHILDFRTGEDFNHPLIVAAAAIALPMTLAGLVLLVIRLSRDLRVLRRRA